MIKRSPASLVLLGAWLALLAVLTWMVTEKLAIGADLRLFLPDPRTAEQRLLLDEIGEGPASRILVCALTGAEPEQLAATSNALKAELAKDRRLRLIANGDNSLDEIPEDLLAYRYLLSSSFDEQRLDTSILKQELTERARDLASPAAGFLEPLLGRDPTLETIKLVERWQPASQPNKEWDVWFDGRGERALLVLETEAAAYDPAGQRATIDAVEKTFQAVKTVPTMRLIVSGPGVFSALMQERTQGEAQWLGIPATIAMLLLVLIAYRSVAALLLSALPLASAALAGLSAVSVLFGTVHGITLAFGFTLIGVAQDYPIHLLSHEHQGQSPLANARALWPTLATGVASTCVAYLSFLFSGVTGLKQLATFTVAGLLVAGLTTRYLLPRMLAPSRRDVGDSARLAALWDHIRVWPSPRWLIPVLAVLGVVLIAAGRVPLWENNLATLTPVPQPLLLQDQALRRELGTPDARYLLTVEAKSTDEVLARLELLTVGLERLREQGVMRDFDHAARYLPSHAVQLRRQAALPTRAELKPALVQALNGQPFRSDAFADFLNDVERARALSPLTFERTQDTFLGARVQSLLRQRDTSTLALVTLSGVRDSARILAFATASGQGVHLLDLKSASETLIASQRDYMLWCLVAAAVLLTIVVAIALRRTERVWRVLAPLALTTILIVGVLHASGTSLTLFHLISLVLAAGLGLDYALFFERAAHDPKEQVRTLHALLVCSLSTLMVFALLACSTLPVLRAIGLTVSLGVLSNFVLALLLTRPREHRA